MNKLVKVFLALVALVIVLFAGLSLYLSILDADKYRPQLVNLISKQTGRVVKLNGPIAFSLGLSGLKISIQDASIANASWGSRPVMAGMGKFELGVGLLPLLTHHLSVHTLSIENADILLETNTAGQHNWEFTTSRPSVAVPAPVMSSSAVQAPSSETSLRIGELIITNSQLAMRGVDGKVSSYNIASLDLTQHSSGEELVFKGDANGTPITLDVKTSLADLLSKDPFTFEADATVSALHVIAQGQADLSKSTANLSAYQLTAGSTTIKGNLSATWSGVRPMIHGTLASDHIDLADFKPDATSTTKNTSSSLKATTNQRLFSDTPLPFEDLKTVDADVDVSVGDFPLGKDALKHITAKLVLTDGNLIMAPVQTIVGGAPIDFQLKLNATTLPAQMTLGIIGSGIDLGDLQKLGNMTPFMSGKAGANIQLTGQGNSEHEIVSSLGGILIITAENGEILTGAAADISSSLAALFNPQGDNAALNCLAVRFIAKAGTLTDNGLLIDSTPSTVAGAGTLNLAAETIDLTLHARTKLVDIGGLVPAMHIGGTLSAPHYTVDAVGMVKNVVGSLLNGNTDVIASSVPTMQVAPQGQNACVYTLDHPQTTTSTGIVPSTAIGKVSQKIQNLGNSLLKGLMGQ